MVSKGATMEKIAQQADMFQLLGTNRSSKTAFTAAADAICAILLRGTISLNRRCSTGRT
jgi:hypothetical protein